MKRLSLSLSLVALLLLSFVSLPVVAQEKSAEVWRLEQQRRNIQREIERVNSLISKTAKTTREELQKLRLMEGQIADRQKMINTLTEEVAATDQILSQMEVEIAQLQAQFERRQESYVQSLRAMQHNNSGTKDKLLFILSAEDFSQGLRRARYLGEYAIWQRKEGEKIKALRLELEEKRKVLEQQRQQKALLLVERENEQRELEKAREQIQAQVRKLKGEEGKLQKELRTQRQQAAALNRQIEAQIAKEIAAAEAARKKAKGTSEERKAKTKGGYAMSAEELKLSANFEDNRGKLPAPISGQYRLVGRFGVYSPTGLKHVRVENGGIDLQGAAGAEARAVFDGVVTKIFVVEGYNNSIIVRHGNYLTVYSNITEVYVRTGDKVTTGQALGKIYVDTTGSCTLHFQLWRERTKLDPERWIR